jgi:protein-S-isoprenylcysteine O-methyltransferase Ste14
MAIMIFALNVWVFIRMSIPATSEYMARKYGDVWRRYERDVPSRIIPGVL